MHIPDGYLSPSTCAVFYAASTPFWYVALRRVKRTLSGQTIPLLALFAAFSFMVMMFNLPLPGGTTGHAVGMAIGAILLGPEVGLLAISIALFIQALFFGDGGITAYGANCFNMAIVGSLVASVVYRLLAGSSPLRSKRRVVAAGFAGYLAINTAALCAAIEFGVQPMWFHDSAGAPLYAPYPLKIAIPAMMLGHMTIAGLAEFAITAGLVRYLQSANVDLLRRSASSAELEVRAPRNLPLRAVWIALGVLVVLTPLGLLASGKAWGEWKPEELMAPPKGLLGLAKLWHAPMAEYSPAFLHNAVAGYVLSAAMGVGFIVLAVLAIRYFLTRGRATRSVFIEKTLRALLVAGQEALFAENTTQLDGLLQKLDPRVKIAGLAALIIAAVSVRRIEALAALFGVSLVCAMLSRISPWLLAKRVWLPVLLFTGVIALPAALFGKPMSAVFLLLRAEVAATFSILLILTTVWSHLLRSLRFFRVPVSAIAVVSISYRYIFVFLESAKQTLEARETRLVGQMEPAAERRFAAASVAALLHKTLGLSSEVHQAMQARGFRGEVYLLQDLKMAARDWWQLSLFLAISVVALGLGR